ncbi:MAG: hypothetical protein KGM16_13675 [Bacteroidota bacterium]|nr:hypothetical protein [Bacteroidota bacterium]
MLVPAMNHQEIAAQIKREYHKIFATTLLRVGAEYDRERRKLKVSKEAIYPKEYEIKTAGKNNWIIFLHKGPGEKKYTGTQSLCVLCVVYYYSDKGLMAYYVPEDDALLTGFTAHFFKRYNERLRLNLPNPVEIVKAFFRKGMYCTLKIVERNNRPHIIAFGVDGIRFAEIMYDFTYVEWRTFVPRELAFRKQVELERELTEELMREMRESEKEETYNPLLVTKLKNRVVSLPMAS